MLCDQSFGGLNQFGIVSTDVAPYTLSVRYLGNQRFKGLHFSNILGADRRCNQSICDFIDLLSELVGAFFAQWTNG